MGLSRLDDMVKKHEELKVLDDKLPKGSECLLVNDEDVESVKAMLLSHNNFREKYNKLAIENTTLKSQIEDLKKN